jgi:predicted DNA-binding transcriptional regulator YafY
MTKRVHKHRYRQLVRCLHLRSALATGAEIEISGLATRFHVSTRTIRRDLAALRAAGEKVPSGVEADISL